MNPITSFLACALVAPGVAAAYFWNFYFGVPPFSPLPATLSCARGQRRAEWREDAGPYRDRTDADVRRPAAA